ncbi:hypothetical protein BI036_gp088 [Morganella phage vB_MmoM_MP1]|uniref:Uncharacterized protein n=1 Tax=Morganella phage vB_MmoM_MP1 TaxID=1852628 RepID=A0A192YAY5_9CAUD|nr:hypothetical protein BI036_gp088 [Morganella phage vB_MmoM_MP1]ANM46638.1 hypothetical protein MP1_gp0087 [Morganella phage vB_MmoM_MP1]
MISKAKLKNMSVKDLEIYSKDVKTGISKRKHIFEESQAKSDYEMLKRLENHYSEVKDVLSHKKRFDL